MGQFTPMSAHVAGRLAEIRTLTDFLTATKTEPSALTVEGEPGIGKTTLWLTGLNLARERGFTVLSTRAAAAESVFAYASLADLLHALDESTFTSLPHPQRLALDQVLLTADASRVATDQRAVGAAFLSVIETLTESAPVLLAIDDLQWLDPSSAQVLGYAVRRLPQKASVLATVRDDPRSEHAAWWRQLPRPDAITRIRLGPLSLGATYAVVRERTGRSFPRPSLIRIHELSAGNPFYAIELARVIGNESVSATTALPHTLTEAVRARIGSLDGTSGDALLAAACLPAPTIDLIAGAIGTDVEIVVGLLSEAEARGVVVIDSGRVRFAHPILAHGVHTDVGRARRRRMHQRLAEVVGQPELRARHLALASISGDQQTLHALDEAAETARIRGAPAAAAELLDLAIGLGGDTAQRRIRSAHHHFNAGDPGRARAVLDETIAQLPPGVLRAEAATLLGYVRLFDDSFPEAADLIERALPEAADDLAVLVPMQVTLSFALFNAGHLAAAMHHIEDAVADAERLGRPDLLSQALSMRTALVFLRGDGVDQSSLRRALELEDHEANIPSALAASVHNPLLLACTGQLDQAHDEMTSLRKHCIERGEDGALMLVAFHGALTEVWRGNFTDAALIVEDTVELAQQLGGDLPLSVALTIRALLAAYQGRVEVARSDVGAAQAASIRCGSDRAGDWPTMTLGFLEVSLGNHRAALDTLQPLLAKFHAALDATEIIVASSVPDAAEAMIALGRLDESEPLVDALERNGRRLDRAWMLAVGGRCRAMLLAARGDVTAASEAAKRAMVQHDRLPMPFERARTQLLVGQLQRRQRRNNDAATTLGEALATFEDLGTPLWADRVRAELGRANVGPHSATTLTASEQRVAELAAAGKTNRDVAAALFISPKTVEANLARIYRKLGIHSRAELGQHMKRFSE